MNVYLAASAADMDRARYYYRRLVESGVTVVSTWISLVDSQPGGSNPRDATYEQRLAWSQGDLTELEGARILWFLVPPVDKPTRGAWCELAYAHSLNHTIVCSGDTKQSIFCALGQEYANDEIALDAVIRLAGAE